MTGKYYDAAEDCLKLYSLKKVVQDLCEKDNYRSIADTIEDLLRVFGRHYGIGVTNHEFIFESIKNLIRHHENYVSFYHKNEIDKDIRSHMLYILAFRIYSNGVALLMNEKRAIPKA